jgi:hypothetical protein
VADKVGITETDYDDGGGFNKNTFVIVYTTNERGQGKESFYRINRAEVSWGTARNSSIGTIIKYESWIDRKTGIIKRDLH